MSAGIVRVEDVIRYIADQYTKHKMLVPYWLKVGDVPRADVVEVVRCGECKHRHLDGMVWNCPFGLPGGEDFFCAYGVKGGDSYDG